MNAKDVTLDSEFNKFFLVGDFGTGKSAFATSMPTPGYVFDFDEGINLYSGFDFEYSQYDLSWKGWLEFEKELIQVKKDAIAGKYKSIIVDSTTAMTDLAMQRSMQLDPKRDPTEGPIWNVHYQMVRNLMEGKLRQIIALPCNIVVIAHLEVITDQKTGKVIGLEPLLTGQLSVKVPGYFSEVYYCTTRRKEDKTQYIIQTVPIGLQKARSRLSGLAKRLDDFIPNNYNILMKNLKKPKKGKKDEKK